VKSCGSANEGMRLLQSDVDGRATFLVHPEDAQAKFLPDGYAHHQPTPRPEELIFPEELHTASWIGFGPLTGSGAQPSCAMVHYAGFGHLPAPWALEEPWTLISSRSNGECFHRLTVTGQAAQRRSAFF